LIEASLLTSRQLFNQTVSLFSGTLLNTPETIMDGRLATKGRIEYQYRAFGGVTILLIEVKLEIGSFTERLNCVAQVIAECDGCAWTNHKKGYDIPIMAVLCDGVSFSFYKFVNKRHVDRSPQFFLGQFPDGQTIIRLDEFSPCPTVDSLTFYRKLRRMCEAFYYVFLVGYQAGLDAYWTRSVNKAKKEGKERESTPKWHNARILAKRAIEEAVLAWNQFNEGKRDESVVSRENAVRYLAERYDRFVCYRDEC
jgi:hypothetical protein